MAIFLLHFTKPYHHCRHYLGCSKMDYNQWIISQVSAGGGVLPAAYEAGVGLELAYEWPDGDMRLMRMIKRQNNAARYCPICKEEKRKRKGELI